MDFGQKRFPCAYIKVLGQAEGGEKIAIDLWSFVFGMLIGAIMVGIAWQSYRYGLKNASKAK